MNAEHEIRLNRWNPRFLRAARLRRWYLLVFNLLLLTSLAASSVLAAPSGGSLNTSTAGDSLYLFTSERVETSKFFHWMGDRSLRMDSNKHLHLAYGGDHLYYLYYNGSVWQYELVDSIAGTGKYASLALDGNNRPHIAYYDAARGALKYARKIAANWEVFTVDSSIHTLGLMIEGFDLETGYTGQDTPDLRDWRFTIPGSGSLLDQEFLPEIGELILGEPYFEAGEPVLSEQEPESGSIDQEFGLTDLGLSAAAQYESGVGLFPSIGINSFGTPFISYYDGVNGNLKFARWEGATWNIQTVDSNGDVGQFSSLAIDSSDYPHISYYDASRGNLRYIRWTGSAWTAPVVIDNGGDDGDTVKYVGLFTSIAVDASRNPHISYYDQDNGNLKYARYTGSSWSVINADTSGDVGLHTSIVLDQNGRAHITYYNASAADLKYAFCSGGSCTTQTIAAEGFVGRFSSVVVDGTAIRVSFYDSGAGQLKWAYPSGSNWIIQILDYSADVGLFSSLALNANGEPRIAYFDDVKDDLKYAYWENGSWFYGTVDQSGEVGLYASLALNKTNSYPHIAYYDASNKRLKYAFWNGTAWDIRVVDNGPEVGTHASLGLDSSGMARIAYCAGKGCTTGKTTDLMELRVALFNGSNWVIKAVETGGAGLYASLAIDNTNNIHVSYYDVAHQRLKYARGNADGSFWEVRIADGSPSVGLFTSLALDSSNRPHIAYFDDHMDRLRYTTLDGDWRHEVVDGSGPVGGYTSIALDSSGAPHISYYDFSRHALKYARKLTSGWAAQTADNYGQVGMFSSLALKDGTTPVVSYYDATSGDLKYAYPYGAASFVFLPVIQR
jgi:hypothetical protein